MSRTTYVRCPLCAQYEGENPFIRKADAVEHWASHANEPGWYPGWLSEIFPGAKAKDLLHTDTIAPWTSPQDGTVVDTTGARNAHLKKHGLVSLTNESTEKVVEGYRQDKIKAQNKDNLHTVKAARQAHGFLGWKKPGIATYR